MELEQHINGSGNLDPSGVGAVVTLKDGTKIRAPEASRIAYEDEPRLMLLREWSLFDSMLCSSYLKTWSDNGLKKLKLLLARMGFPLADCQKRFQYMSMEVKRKMQLRLDSFYARLHAAAAASAADASSPLLILPSTADADALCALKVLTHVLSADSIRFSIYPVASAAAAASLLASFSASQPLCLLLINWGAHRDLRAVLPPAATAFVVDSHRPIHLHNLSAANDRVVVLFTTDDEHTADLSYDFDVSSLADASDLSAQGEADDHLRVAEEDEDSDASDSDSDGEGGRRKRRRLSDDAEADGDPERLVHGYRSKVSAADVVYGVTALLESLNAESKDSKGSSAAEQFWVAYSALSLSNVDQLRKGMQSAIEIQRAILRQGSSAITKTGFIRSAKKFRWVKLDDPVDTDKLCQPQALTKFCFFLMDALRERGARMKPLICACLAREPEKVLVVGVCGKPRLGAVKGNAFGNAFRSAAEEIGADYFHDMFESSWIVLDVVAVSSFMIRLTEKL
uniref:Uncharacterized protein n=1 Tax=Oryza rufipogon TaxID=4529 RepID=A0A0E0RD51_ORYRU